MNQGAKASCAGTLRVFGYTPCQHDSCTTRRRTFLHNAQAEVTCWYTVHVKAPAVVVDQ